MRWSPDLRTHCIGLAVVLMAIYGQSLSFPFQFDDGHSIVQNPHVRSLANVPSFFLDASMFSVDASLTMYRPLVLTSYAFNYAVSGQDPWSYHLANMVLHFLTSVAVGVLARMLLGSASLAWLAAWLFAVHPIHSETVCYVSSRSESLAALAVLVAMCLHLGERRGWSGTLGVVSFAAGLMAKSSAIALLPLLLAHDLLIKRGDWRRRWRLHAAYAGVAILYVMQSRAIIVEATLSTPVRSYSEQWWTQVKALAYYVQLLVVPRGLSVDHQFLISDSLIDPYAAMSTALVLSLAGIAIVTRNGWALFLGAWFLAALAPASLVPLNVLVNEHRLYLAAAAALFGIGSLVRSDVRARRGLLWIIPILAVLASQRGEAWASAQSLWQDAATKGPGMARPIIMLGFEAERRGDRAATIRAMSAALQRDSTFVPAYVSLSNAHLDLGQIERASQVAQTATRVRADSARTWIQLAQVENVIALRARDGLRKRAFEASAKAYLRALELSPEDADLHDNLGNTYQTLGRPGEAVAHHERAIALKPDRVESRLNYGNVLLMLGQLEDAVEQYRRVLAQDPEYVRAWLNLSLTLQRLGQDEEAAQAIARARGLGWEPTP